MKLSLLLMALAAMPLSAQQIQVQAPQAAVKQQGPVVLNSAYMLQDATVVRELSAGQYGKVELVRMQNGRLCKRVTTNDNRIRIAHQQASGASLAAESDAFYEDFSGWDGATSDWIPSDWTENNTKDSIVLTSPSTYTWHVEEGGMFMDTPEHGKYCCAIYFATASDSANHTFFGNQDEWLISPEFSPKDKERLQYSLSFTPFYMFNTDSIDWETEQFTVRLRTASVQTYLQVDGGEWTLLHDPYDDWKDASMETLWDDGLESDWRTYRYDMAQYVGHKLRVAFRYVGSNGENWAIDYAGCSVPQPQAHYKRPTGAFYYGYDEDYSSLSVDSMGLIIVPGNNNLTWTNTSNEDADSFSWSYDCPANGDSALRTSTDVDLTVSYPALSTEEYNWYGVPELSAIASGIDTSVYSAPIAVIQAGGYAHYTFTGDEKEYHYGVGNYVVENKFTNLNYSEGTPLYGISANTNAAWNSLLRTDSATVIAVCNYFQKPVVPYQLNQVAVLCYTTAEIPADAEIGLTLVRVSNKGYLTDTIATSVCTGTTAHLAGGSSGSYYYSLPFTFTDTIDGFESNTDLTIQDAIAVFLDVKDAKNINQLSCFMTYKPDADKETNGYIYIQMKNGKRNLYSVASLSTSLGPCYSSFLFSLYLTYPFEYVDDIKTVSRGSIATEGRCYNLAGQLMKSGAKGLCIMKDNNGNIRKMWK